MSDDDILEEARAVFALAVEAEAENRRDALDDLRFARLANPFGIYGDPESTAADSGDWNTAFVVDSLPGAAFAARWKGGGAPSRRQRRHVDARAFVGHLG